MLISVYKSLKKPDTYLYITKRDDFSQVPEALMQMFGTPSLVTIINAAKQTKLALADLAKVKQALNEQGFYLQLPPPPENLLKQHLAAQGKQID